MARASGDSGNEAWSSGRSKSKSRRSYSTWDSACKHAQSRIEIHSKEPSKYGYVYIMRDATGWHKVGSTLSIANRFWVVRRSVCDDRQPVSLVRAFRVPIEQMRWAERFSHSMLCRRKTWHNEWFNVSTRTCMKYVRVAVAEAMRVRGRADRYQRAYRLARLIHCDYRTDD
jgi:hypothetical protein